MSDRPNLYHVLKILFFSGILSLFWAGSTSAADEEMLILTRGQVHEAFAEVSVDESHPDVVTSRSVPEPINEIPPDFQPEGENIQWISGYWSWDDDQDDFVWISGIWRDIPPGREWVPGYWIAVEGGSQYVSGYWAEVNQTETVYLPAPPQPLQTEPNISSVPGDDVWIEGNWVWYNDRYAWQPGYWHEPQPDMLWVPSHYVWTPRGYIFVRGYWDYLMIRRGVMFAPCYFPRPLYQRPGYYYTPTIMLDIDNVFFSLFIRRHHHHYYFGDYYEQQYERRGFRPWYSERATIYGHDPFYRSYRSYHLRHDRQWEHNYRQQYEYRRAHRDARPAAIYNTNINIHVTQPRVSKQQIIGRPLAEVATRRDQPIHFKRLKPEYKRKIQVRELHRENFALQRRNQELNDHGPRRFSKNNDLKKAEKVQKSNSPMTDISRRPARPGTYDTQPKRPVAPKKNLQAPKPKEQVKPPREQVNVRSQADRSVRQDNQKQNQKARQYNSSQQKKERQPPPVQARKTPPTSHQPRQDAQPQERYAKQNKPRMEKDQQWSKAEAPLRSQNNRPDRQDSFRQQKEQHQSRTQPLPPTQINRQKKSMDRPPDQLQNTTAENPREKKNKKGRKSTDDA